jgi:3'-phosphoadenosine 5'-phosphosulfate sulfotransferase (PAPS reductase)/FAD synthetase
MPHYKTPSRLVLPQECEGATLVLSLSGGKDSVAAGLALKEAGLECRYVFADTGWELPDTYQHLDHLQELLGWQIDRVGVPGGLPAVVRQNGRFPGRLQRWCTPELKVQPLRAYHEQLRDEGADTVAVLGIRHEEGTASNGRGDALEVEWDERWDGLLWRPIVRWKIEDVVAIHQRHSVPLNPLYHKGFERVGCFCIFASKQEIRLVADLYPEKIDEVEILEQEASALRQARNLETPGRYTHEDATFFQTRRKGLEGIRAVVDWARTDYGGRQYELFPRPPGGGCARWGLCEYRPPGSAGGGD